MPKITAHGKIFRDWEGLLGAVERNASLLPQVDPRKAALEAILAKARDMKAQQEDLDAKKQATTQALQQLVDEGQETARKLRAFVVSSLGSRTELLKQFGLPPRRRRSSKQAEQLPDVATPKVVLPPLGPPDSSINEQKGDEK
jgi:hypothetical protein